MRSFILVIFTAIALAGLFIGYWTMQPGGHGGGAGAAQGGTPTIPDPRSSHLGEIRPGDVVWLKQYDDRGELSSEFRGDEYVPQPDGTVNVKNPIAKFFLANHQHIEVHGTDGNVIVKNPPDLSHSGFASPGPPGPPSRGRLNNVVVHLIDETQADPKLAKVLTMTTNNAVFDNEMYWIRTEGYRDVQGREIADDQVPVHVTGQIEMEGRGLTVRWNDKDGRLELLEIAHGQWLKIKNPSKSPFGGGAKEAKPRSVALLPGAPLPEMLAATDKSADARIITSHPKPQTRPHRARAPSAQRGPGPVIYLASFYDNVRITQADPTGQYDQIQIGGVNRMDVDFILKESKEAPTTQSVGAAVATSAPASRPSEAGAAAPGTPPATRPATQPAPVEEPPVLVRWTGVLRITPLRSAPPAPLAPGDSAVTLVGSPVAIHRIDPKQHGTQDIRCASVLYETASEKAHLEHSEQFPQILVTKFPPAAEKDQRITRLTSTGTVEYSRGDQNVVMTGPGYAEVPLEAQQNQQRPLLQAAWAKLAHFDFVQPPGGPDKDPVVRFGHLEGNVDIKHPRLALRGQSLDLLFDPPSAQPRRAPEESHERPGADGAHAAHQAQPNLRQAIATTGVYCQTEDSAGKKQTIECNRLLLDTALADGKLYARHINATGTVHARGQEDDLRAQYVDLLLTPASRAKPHIPDKKQDAAETDATQVELERMLARDNVIARSKDGSVAEGQDLLVTTDDGKQHMVLTSPVQAKVTDVKGNIVTGPRIEFDSDEGRAHVVGAGTMHAVQQASTTQPSSPTDVVWTDRADFNGPENRIDVYGGVAARSLRKGFVDTATGEHILIDLRKKPAPPTTRPILASATQPARKSASPDAGVKMDLFRDKEVVAMTIENRATLVSTLADASGNIEQQFELTGPKIIVRELAPDGTPSRTVTVPTAGKMLVRDHRAPQKQQPGGDDSSGARGATAFQWVDPQNGQGLPARLVYSERDRRADITGDVTIAHQDENTKQPPTNMKAEQVTAFFEPAPRRSAARAQPNKADDEPQMQLKHLTAQGSTVLVTHDTDQMTARRVDYDPRRHLMIATGSQRNPVVFMTVGTGRTICTRVEWDTITWNPRFTNAILDSRPPTPGVQSQAPAPKTQPALRPDRRPIP